MNATFDGRVYAPWDEETVEALDTYQHLGVMHPYTCPRDHYDPDTGRRDRTEQVLDATEAGWVCPVEHCGYTQMWAHGFSANMDVLLQMKADHEKIFGDITGRQP